MYIFASNGNIILLGFINLLQYKLSVKVDIIWWLDGAVVRINAMESCIHLYESNNLEFLLVTPCTERMGSCRYELASWGHMCLEFDGHSLFVCLFVRAMVS